MNPGDPSPGGTDAARKFCVVGLGSMGKRRIRILKDLCPGVPIIGVDSRAERCEEAAALLGVETCRSLASGLAEGPDTVLVCTSPQTHAGVFSQLDLDRFHTFSELDLLTDGYARLIEAEGNGRRRHFLSSTPLFDAAAGLIANHLAGAGRIAYRYHVGQYLPDWHPWESYKDFFIGQRETNGCREILAVELPWLLALFGPGRPLSVERQRLTGLDIDFPDCLSVTFKHDSGMVGQLVVDVACRYPIHDFEVFGENVYLTWDGRPDGIRIWQEGQAQLVGIQTYANAEHRQGYAETIIENPYRDEVRTFLAGLQDPAVTYPFGYAASGKVLALIDEIEGRN